MFTCVNMSRILSENSDCLIRRKGAPLEESLPNSSKKLITTASADTTCSISDFDTKATGQHVAECELTEDDQFYIWKRNSSLLYDMLLLHRLDWPSLTVDLMDANTSKIKGSQMVNKVLIGTHTSQQETEFVILGEIRTPLYQPMYCVDDFENHADFSVKRDGASLGNVPSFELKARLVHPSEVNRIAHMPNNQFYFASQTNFGDVLVFDYSKHPSVPVDTSVSHPQFVLQHHLREGYGLCWNTGDVCGNSKQLPLLTSCSSDGGLCLWDLSNQSQKKYAGPGKYVSGCQLIDPVVTLTNKVGLNDVKFLEEYSPVAGTVSDDGKVQIFDFRSSSINASSLECTLTNTDNSISHNNQLNCLSFNPYSNTIVATGGDSGLIHLWDLRWPNGAIKKILHHKEPVTQIQFSSFSAGIFASSSHDGTVAVYDLGNSKISDSFASNSNVEELIFIHKGHQGSVNDFCWSKIPRYGHTIASVGQDNSFQCWRPLLK